jgi:hypothetical protein
MNGDLQVRERGPIFDLLSGQIGYEKWRILQLLKYCCVFLLR